MIVCSKPSDKPQREPTVEERGKRLFRAWGKTNGPLSAKLTELFYQIEDEIRAAVEAERERCAATDPYKIECPLCKARAGYACINSDTAHPARWVAAIRGQEDE